MHRTNLPSAEEDFAPKKETQLFSKGCERWEIRLASSNKKNSMHKIKGFFSVFLEIEMNILYSIKAIVTIE